MDESRQLFAEVMRSSSILRGVAAEPERYRIQVLFSEVVETGSGRPVLRRYSYREDAEYWYPASTVKLLAAVAAMQKFERLSSELDWLTLDTPLLIRAHFEGEIDRELDQHGNRLTLRGEIRKTLIVSDNPSFNVLYDFVGPEELNKSMRSLGLTGCMVIHRLALSRTASQNRQTPPVEFTDGIHSLQLDATATDSIFDAAFLARLPGYPEFPLGRGEWVRPGEIIPEPMRMSGKNAVPLRDIQNMLVMLVRPDIDIGLRSLDLNAANRAVLVDAVTDLPSQSVSPRFDPEVYTDDYPHFFRAGVLRVIPAGEAVISNKIGQAYGFTSETAYIQHAPSGRAFFLAMVVYTNDNAILNDSVYEYDLAREAMANVAKYFAERVFK